MPSLNLSMPMVEPSLHIRVLLSSGMTYWGSSDPSMQSSWPSFTYESGSVYPSLQVNSLVSSS